MPDYIYETCCQVDRFSRKDFFADIEQNPIAKIDRIVESKQQDRRSVCIREILKDTLSSKRRLRLLTRRSDGCLLVGAAGVDGNKGVDVSS